MTNSKDNDIYYKILAKKLSSQASPLELDKLRQMPANTFLDENSISELEKVWKQSFFEQGNSEIVGQREISNKIWAKSFSQKQSRKRHKFSISFISRIAASFIILVAIGLVVNKMLEKKEVIAPVTTLITKETFPGQKSTITLSDGTVVWLNSGSKISFTNYFNDSIREIHMDGQAYFEVFKDPNKPFRVYCRDIVVEALGTSFDVNGYSEMSLQVSLVTGSAKVSHNEDGQEMVLKPGEYSRFNHQNEFIGKGKFDQDYLLAWKDGKIIFKNATIDVIIARLELWYGVKIENLSSVPKDKPFTGVFEKENLENILTNIGDVMDFEYIISGNNVKLNNSVPM